jgi:hypothetical protein
MTAIGLLGFFVWNALFGGVGGLMLCFNNSPVFPAESITSKDFDYPHICVGIGGSAEVRCLSNEGSCVDVELIAVELPQVRINEVQSMPVFAAFHGVTPEAVEQNFTLKEIAHIVQAQAPPELMDTSVLVAQTVNLRL